MNKIILTFSFIFFFTLPLFAQVDTAWVRRYNGITNLHDEARALAMDNAGNVFVTGSSYGSETSFDYATIKYYPNGDTSWVRRYNGMGNYKDGATSIAVDDSGNVYVTGTSSDSVGRYDYATIKYDPDGNELWVRRYNGPKKGYDYAHAIAVDGSGNVYVTGWSEDYGTFEDYATIKYDPDGNELWVRRYNGVGNEEDYAYAIDVDGSGNVYVAGSSATIKYDPNGSELWVRSYPGSGFYAMVVDSASNVYVTGNSITTKFDTNGNQLWITWWGSSAMAIDVSCNVYVAGSSYGDYVIKKYDTNGNELWVRRYNRPGDSTDIAFAIAVDHSGDAYVTGRSYGDSGTYYDYATIKYDSNGNVLWVRRYNGPGNSSDMAFAIAVDGSSNVYVTGGSEGSGTYSDYTTIKYVNVQFVRGDANGDKHQNVSDVIYLINYLLKSGSPPNTLEAGDLNCDGQVNVNDIIYLVNYLFKDGPPPVC